MLPIRNRKAEKAAAEKERRKRVGGIKFEATR